MTSNVVERQERLENATCGRGFSSQTQKKKNVFKNIRIRVNRQNRFENAACGRRFFSKTGEKNLHFQKYSQADKSNSAS